MFIVFLKFSDNRQQAPEYMDAHNEWIERGFEDAVFLLVGSLQAGGAILAHNTSMEALSQRVAEDPFVAANVVSAEIEEISAHRAEPRLQFLVG